jgi:hypothetical protein
MTYSGPAGKDALARQTTAKAQRHQQWIRWLTQIKKAVRAEKSCSAESSKQSTNRSKQPESAQA